MAAQTNQNFRLFFLPSSEHTFFPLLQDKNILLSFFKYKNYEAVF